MSSCEVDSVLPGNVLVVVDALFEASMQNPDPAIGELTDGLTVGRAPTPQFVVIGARPW
jgi:hypothetical protein